MRGLLLLGAVLAGLAPVPRAEITSAPSGEVSETSAVIEFHETGPAPLGSFQCRLDGSAWSACTSPHSIEGLGGGAHVFEVRLRGQLTDPEPDRAEWVVKQQTEVLPCGGGTCASPLPDPPAAAPPAPPPERPVIRRDYDGCPFAGNEPGEVAAARIRRAVRCLVNEERTSNALAPLRFNARLERASARHARDMVSRRYFAHESPGGRRVGDRAKKAGYLRGTRYWTVGEVLAWLVRPRPTPRAVVEAWMASEPHRAVILHASFREIGVSFAHGNPRASRGDGATFAAVLGRRTR